MSENRKKIHLPGEDPIILAGAADGESYIPLDDYPARNYKPIGGRGDSHFCDLCKANYKDMYDKGITSKEFIPKCVGDLEQIYDGIDPSEFGSDEEYNYLKVVSNPASWAKFELDWDARWFQKEVLNCSSQFKAIRAGRRAGKSESMALLALWYLFTNGGLQDRQFQILMVAPYMAQVSKFFDSVRGFIKQSSSMSMPGVIKRNVINPQVIEFAQGGVMRGFSSGGTSTSSAGSDKVRGQDADLIIIDEVDYVADIDIEVVIAILGSHPGARLIAASTPTGFRSKLYEWCRNKESAFKEFWFISAESPTWTADTEKMFKENYSESGYNREFLAEFGEEAAGVFRPKDIQKSIADYDMEKCFYRSECEYVIGVDWNKTTGTHITVVEAISIQGEGVKYRLVDKEIIRKSEFQQIEGVKRLMEVDKKWGGNNHIYVDAGFGHVQVEMMWKYDVDHPMEKTDYRNKVKPITMNTNIEIRDPVTGQIIKKPVKQFMVDNAARSLENGMCLVPREEDTATRIVPSEVAFSNIGLAQQMREFKIMRYTPSGMPTYSQDYEHTLTAWMLALMGHLLEYSDINQMNLTSNIAYSEGMASGHHKPKEYGDDGVTTREAMEDAKGLAKDMRPEKREASEETPLYGRDAGSIVASNESRKRMNKRAGKSRGFGGTGRRSTF